MVGSCDRIDEWWRTSFHPHDSTLMRQSWSSMKDQNPQPERNGASPSVEKLRGSFVLDTAVVVIDKMTQGKSLGSI